MVEFLKTNVYKISSIYKQAKQIEDIDKCHHLCRLFTELGEALLEMICNTPGEGLGDLTTVNLVLDGLDHYDWEVSYVTFNFWYRLCETLQESVFEFPPDHTPVVWSGILKYHKSRTKSILNNLGHYWKNF